MVRLPNRVLPKLSRKLPEYDVCKRTCCVCYFVVRCNVLSEFFECLVMLFLLKWYYKLYAYYQRSNTRGVIALLGNWNVQLCLILVLCDTHDTSILIVDTYATILVSPMSRYTAVYRSSTKYRETAQVSRVSSIPCSSYQLAFSNVHITSLPTSVNKYSPIFFALTQHYTHKTVHL